MTRCIKAYDNGQRRGLCVADMWSLSKYILCQWLDLRLKAIWICQKNSLPSRLGFALNVLDIHLLRKQKPTNNHSDLTPENNKIKA